ncbi:MAG: 2-oxoacid:acceptor oxidoreductase family protein [Deltaproteobacteria bacterium]|nr:2-oxoacid:acceptor oxidoreductase family protein [Deltaproteobacteria bacterium]
MAERKEVRLAGAGQHGMIQAGLILQEAAAIYDDLNAHHVQSYGPEARSNAARSEVIISDGDIDFPKATQIDVFVATTQEAVEAYAHDLKPTSQVIVDLDLVGEPPKSGRSVALPLVATAEKDLQRPALLPIVTLGALVELTGIVSKSAIEAAVKDHAAKGAEDIHQKALEAGYRLVREKKSPGGLG